MLDRSEDMNNIKYLLMCQRQVPSMRYEVDMG